MKKKAKDKENSPYYQKKAVLSSISRKMRSLRIAKAKKAKTALEREYWETRTINQMLMIILYNKNEDQVFNTFNQWKKEGATVKKGSKAIVIWGQPTKATKEKETPNPKPDAKTETEEFEFFPLCYLISSKDVILPEVQTEPETVEPEPQEQEPVYTL